MVDECCLGILIFIEHGTDIELYDLYVHLIMY